MYETISGKTRMQEMPRTHTLADGVFCEGRTLIAFLLLLSQDAQGTHEEDCEGHNGSVVS